MRITTSTQLNTKCTGRRHDISGTPRRSSWTCTPQSNSCKPCRTSCQPSRKGLCLSIDQQPSRLTPQHQETSLGGVRGREACNIAVKRLMVATRSHSTQKHTGGATETQGNEQSRTPCPSDLQGTPHGQRPAQCNIKPKIEPATRKSAMVIGCRMAPKQL